MGSKALGGLARRRALVQRDGRLLSPVRAAAPKRRWHRERSVVVDMRPPSTLALATAADTFCASCLRGDRPRACARQNYLTIPSARRRWSSPCPNPSGDRGHGAVEGARSPRAGGCGAGEQVDRREFRYCERECSPPRLGAAGVRRGAVYRATAARTRARAARRGFSGAPMVRLPRSRPGRRAPRALFGRWCRPLEGWLSALGHALSIDERAGAERVGE